LGIEERPNVVARQDPESVGHDTTAPGACPGIGLEADGMVEHDGHVGVVKE
jgi:hypothetical protein